MGLVFYGAKNISTPSSLKEHYNEFQQALINDLWSNTTTLKTIAQETELGSFLFQNVEVRLNHAIDKSTGIKQGNDFRELIFKEINYEAPKGLYYYFNDNYWLTINLDNDDRMSKNVFVRRCNNKINVADRNNGNIYSLPCIVDYDVGASSPQVDNNIITPNNHPVIIIQGNEISRRLLQQNTRVILGNRVFKITGLNNIMKDNALNNNASILYLDVFQDEINPLDDFNNNVAYNYSTNYSINLPIYEINQVQGYEFKINPTIKLDDDIVERPFIIKINNENIAKLIGDNTIKLIGKVNETTEIKVYLSGNSDIYKTIKIKIVESLQDEEDFIITPLFDVLKQGQTQIFTVNLIKNNIIQSDKIDIITNLESKYFDLKRIEDNTFSIKCNYPNETPLVLTLTNGEKEKNIQINLITMF